MKKEISLRYLWKIRSKVATGRLYLNVNPENWPFEVVRDFRKALLDLELSILSAQIKLISDSKKLGDNGRCPLEFETYPSQ